MKQCLLCPAPVPSRHKLCYQCFKQYRYSMNEPWFLALVELQRVQDRIDTRECYVIDNRSNADLYGEMIQTPVKVSKKAIGRPRTDWKTVNKVLELFDNSVDNATVSKQKRLSLRAISKLVDGKIGFVTVRSILLKYRREIFLNKQK